MEKYNYVYEPNQDSLAKDLIKIYQDFPIDGVKYLDLNPVYQNSEARTQMLMHCVEALQGMPEFDYIACVESRGFLLGSLIAHIMDKGIILVRSKPGRLPGDKVSIKHTLEYGDGQMEVQVGSGKILIFDDVVATGGTATAAYDCLTQAGYTPMAALFLVELTYLPCELYHGNELPTHSILKYGGETWEK